MNWTFNLLNEHRGRGHICQGQPLFPFLIHISTEVTTCEARGFEVRKNRIRLSRSGERSSKRDLKWPIGQYFCIKVAIVTNDAAISATLRLSIGQGSASLPFGIIGQEKDQGNTLANVFE